MSCLVGPGAFIRILSDYIFRISVLLMIIIITITTQSYNVAFIAFDEFDLEAEDKRPFEFPRSGRSVNGKFSDGPVQKFTQ